MNNQAKYEKLSQRLQSSEKFKTRFLCEPKSVLTEMGIEVSDSISIQVHEDTVKIRNFVIPASLSDEDETTASNPLFRKAISQAHADESFKIKLINDPKNTLAELTGENLPGDLDIYIHENTPTLKHLVIFVDSASQELNDRELEAVAGGISLPRPKFPPPLFLGFRIDSTKFK